MEIVMLELFLAQSEEVTNCLSKDGFAIAVLREFSPAGYPCTSFVGKTHTAHISLLPTSGIEVAFRLNHSLFADSPSPDQPAVVKFSCSGRLESKAYYEDGVVINPSYGKPGYIRYHDNGIPAISRWYLRGYCRKQITYHPDGREASSWRDKP